MTKLQQLVDLCKSEVSIEINGHRSNYETVEDFLKPSDMLRNSCYYEEILDIPEDVKAGMLEKDQVVLVQFYPNTPIGFEIVYHHDLDKALDLALAWFENE